MRLESVSSRYWFEINSNVVATNKSPEAVRKLQDFRDGLDRIFLSKNVLNFIDIIDQEDLEDQIPKQKLISKIDSQAVIEVGPARGFLHAHILVTIIHRTTLRFTTSNCLKKRPPFFTSLENLNKNTRNDEFVCCRSSVKNRKLQILFFSTSCDCCSESAHWCLNADPAITRVQRVSCCCCCVGFSIS